MRLAGNTYKDDITSHARNIIKLLRHAKDKDQRITGNKLVEIWMGKGPPALRLSYIKPPQLSRYTEILVSMSTSA